MPQIKTPKFVLLTILDGWGIAPNGPGNAISIARIPNFKKYESSYPHTKLEAAGEAVGLPKGEDGNTETGHINLGAGRIVYQDLERINMAIADGKFFENEVLKSLVDHAKNNKSRIHIMGLVGAAGVHSNINHLYALIHLVSSLGFKDLLLHVFTDGRDSPPTSSKIYINNIKDIIKKEGIGEIASIMGRYWAMDRDRRWDRTKKAYLALVKGEGQVFNTPEEAIESSYKQGKTDEFVEPSLIKLSSGKLGTIKDNDSIIFFNFRIDRPRQLTKVFVLDDFKKANESDREDLNMYHGKYTSSPIFDRGEKLKNLNFVTMTDYGKIFKQSGVKTAFPPEIVTSTLSQIISNSSIKQLKVTESEKERFVTFYFNGLRENPFPMEERIIIPSPKVPTYDQKPEMSAFQVTDTILNKLKLGDYGFILVNFPNPDMVGHTGNIGPAVKAIEVVDECIGKLANFCLAYEGAMLITADHGNVEEMINLSTNEIDTEHSGNLVPFISIYRPLMGFSRTLRSGILADVSPTVLSLMDIPIPAIMTGRDLLKDLILS